MTIDVRIKTALANIGCQTGFQQLDDGAYIESFPSVTYFCYNEQPEGWAEDAETERGYYVQVDVWSKANYMALVDSVIAAMRAADFGYTNGADLQESFGAETVYHKALRFKYTEFK